jgi:hypothetical protein
LNGAGARAGINAQLNIPSQIGLSASGTDTDRQWQAFIDTVAISHNQGGTAPTSGSSAGFAYAGADQAECNNGATDLSGCIGRETDVGIFTGASAAERVGNQVISIGNLNGNDEDYAYKIGAFAGAPGFLIGFGIKGSATFPIASTGAIFQYHPPVPGSLPPTGLSYANPQLALGFDLSGIECSTDCWRSTGGTQISGLGALSVQSLKVSTTSAVVTVDVPGAELASATVGSGGVGYQSTDHLYDPVTGSVLTPSGVSGGAITGYTVVTPGHYTSSAPSNPVALFGGTGAGATANLSWTTATTLDFGPTSATVLALGNSGSTTTINGTIKAGSSTGLSCTGTPTSSFASVNGIVTHC